VPTAATGLHRRTSAATARSAAVAVASVALLAILAACDKPTPGVTVFSGTHSANREAICWSPEADQPVTGSDCSLQLGSSDPDVDKQLIDQVAIIATSPGATVGISVDPVVAADGWVVTINGRALTRDTITDKYFRFTMPPRPLRRGDAQLVIQAVTSGGDGVRGAWLFGLTQE
jgi:hypothetical protein